MPTYLPSYLPTTHGHLGRARELFRSLDHDSDGVVPSMHLREALAVRGMSQEMVTDFFRVCDNNPIHEVFRPLSLSNDLRTYLITDLIH